MSDDLLAKLKAFQYERSDTSPFATDIEFYSWADKVIPLLAFNPDIQREFKSLVTAIQVQRPLKIKEQELVNINNLFGLLNQTIMSLEINPIPNSATKPPAKQPNDEHNWYKKPLGQIGIGVIIALLATMVIYIVKNHLGVSL